MEKIKISFIIKTCFWCMRKMKQVGQPKWSDLEKKILDKFNDCSNEDLAKLLGRTTAAIKQEKYRRKKEA